MHLGTKILYRCGYVDAASGGFRGDDQHDISVMGCYEGDVRTKQEDGYPSCGENNQPSQRCRAKPIQYYKVLQSSHSPRHYKSLKEVVNHDNYDGHVSQLRMSSSGSGKRCMHPQRMTVGSGLSNHTVVLRLSQELAMEIQERILSPIVVRLLYHSTILLAGAWVFLHTVARK